MDDLKYDGIEEFRNGRKTKLKVMSTKMITIVEDEVRRLLHSSRDMMRRHLSSASDSDKSKIDPRRVAFLKNEPNFREAHGIMRAMVRLGYCYFGSQEKGAIRDGATRMGGKKPHAKQNARWWFFQLQKQVLREEGCKTNNACAYCMAKYGRDNTTLDTVVDEKLPERA